MKKSIFLLLVLLISALGALPASADAPVQSELDYEADFGIARCEGFDVRSQTVGHLTASEYYDKDGILVKVLIKDRGKDYLYMAPPGSGPLANPEIVAIGDFNINGHLDLVSLEPFSFTEAITGLIWNVVVPGDGSVFRVSGQSKVLVEDGDVMVVKRAGKFPNQQELCNVLG